MLYSYALPDASRPRMSHPNLHIYTCQLSCPNVSAIVCATHFSAVADRRVSDSLNVFKHDRPPKADIRLSHFDLSTVSADSFYSSRVSRRAASTTIYHCGHGRSHYPVTTTCADFDMASPLSSSESGASTTLVECWRRRRQNVGAHLREDRKCGK